MNELVLISFTFDWSERMHYKINCLCYAMIAVPSIMSIRGFVLTSIGHLEKTIPISWAFTMVLYIIGLGLSDEKDITVKGLEAVKSCERVYLEAYTSILSVGKERLVRRMILLHTGFPGAKPLRNVLRTSFFQGSILWETGDTRG